MRHIQSLRTEADLDQALEEIAVYFDHQPVPGTQEGNRFDALAAMIEAYEDQHHPIGSFDGIPGTGRRS